MVGNMNAALFFVVGVCSCANAFRIARPVATRTGEIPSSSSSFSSDRSLVALPATRSATFGMGCFWAPSEDLLKVEGVVDTVVGYTGAISDDRPPTYDRVCYGREWVEGVRVVYDDDILSYEDLLNSFFSLQKSVVGSRQYGSFIFPMDEEQNRTAKTWLGTALKEELVSKDGFSARHTQIEDATRFFRAEEYHQNYWPKMRSRIAVGVLLLALASGLGNNVVPPEYSSQFNTCVNGLYLAGVIYTYLERKLDTKVAEL